MSQTENNTKPWGGRFSSATNEFVEYFTESVSYDQRLYHYDIMGSIAHVRMLGKAGVLGDSEVETIVAGLQAIEADIDSGQFNWSTKLEDVHMNIETALVERVGEVGKKLHTGRSRNDQIATDIRLYLRDEVSKIQDQIIALIKVILDVAEENTAIILPGFTHMQAAQPVSLGHHLLAWCEMLWRDHGRLSDSYARINILPLGSAALAGTTYPINREFVAEQLGFDGITQNSLDSVSDRDFAIEFSANASLIMMHLSRISEELVLWMSQQFSFIELGDAWCTGSSIMPQKKNPDIPELVRGKSARVYGDLIALLTLMKSQPLAYNRDNQEDKESLFDAIDTTYHSLVAFTGLIPTMKVNADNMYKAAAEGFTTATDLADYLVKKGMPFRDAHEVVGKTVAYAIEHDKPLGDLSLEELQGFSSTIQQDVYEVLTLEGSVNARDHIGGTAINQVNAAIERFRARLS